MTMEKEIEKTFLARVPALIEAGHSIDEAIELAFKQEEDFILEMKNAATTRARLAYEVICHDVYTNIKHREAKRKLDARLEVIADETKILR